MTPISSTPKCSRLASHDFFITSVNLICLLLSVSSHQKTTQPEMFIHSWMNLSTQVNSNKEYLLRTASSNSYFWDSLDEELPCTKLVSLQVTYIQHLISVMFSVSDTLSYPRLALNCHSPSKCTMNKDRHGNLLKLSSIPIPRSFPFFNSQRLIPAACHNKLHTQ